MDNLRFRPRRLRRNPAIRGMVRETRVSKSSLIYPLFVEEGTGIAAPIPSLDGQFRYSPDTPRARAGLRGGSPGSDAVWNPGAEGP